MRRRGRRYSIRVDTEKMSGFNRSVVKALSYSVVGQPRAIQHISRLLVSLQSGLRDFRRPIGTMIFAGPSGCGKTFTAKELAQILLGSSEEAGYPLTIVQCSNLAESHRISTLIGSPPGYVDSNKIPILHRFNIEKHNLMAFLDEEITKCKDQNLKKEKEEAKEQVKKCLQALLVGKLFIRYNKQDINIHNFLNEVFDRARPLLSVVLFDEIEKAHPDVWNLLLSIIEEGQLQLANSGEVTSFTNSLVILTTNTGSREIQGVFGANRIGFQTAQKEDPDKLDQAVYNEAKRALEKIFPPELMGRLGKEIIAFRGLRRDDFEQIFQGLVEEFRWRLDDRGIVLRCSPKFKQFVVDEGVNQKYGARILRDAVKKYVETPISAAISSGELKAGDRALLTMEDGKPVLRRQPRLHVRKVKITETAKEKSVQIEAKNNGQDKEQDRVMFKK